MKIVLEMEHPLLKIMSNIRKIVLVSVWLVIAVFPTGQSQLFGLSPAAVVGDLPDTIVNDILTILINGTVQLIGNCTDSNNASQVQFRLYTRQNPENAIILNSTDEIDYTKPIKMLIHGWGGYADIGYIHVIKEAYLLQYDCNVISVDYSVYAGSNYQTAYCYVPAIAAVVATFICELTMHTLISALHVVGHSLGGQIAGVAGYQVQLECAATIGRITGLDPAGPLFQGMVKSQRLDSSDGTLVDVIHTNQGQYGYIGDCGKTDFFPNCGYYQPGCLEQVLGSITNENIVSSPLRLVSCSHQRSCYLFADSINTNSYYSTSCIGCGSPLCVGESLVPFSSPTYTYMGESCRSPPPPPDREYVCTTNANPPYGQGPVGPLN